MGSIYIDVINALAKFGQFIYELSQSSINFLGYNVNLLAFLGGGGLVALLVLSLVLR